VNLDSCRTSSKHIRCPCKSLFSICLLIDIIIVELIFYKSEHHLELALEYSIGMSIRIFTRNEH